MSITPDRFARKTFYIDAVQVTEENLRDVAEWCGGEIKTVPAQGEGQEISYIEVDVRRPLHPDQNKAFPGSWVSKSGGQCKVYTNKSFRAAFDPAEQNATV